MLPLEPARRIVVGWDVGGAHVKGCLVEDGVLRDVVQWPCPLWQGLQHLDAALAQARTRWPQGWDGDARHVATMTGEMVDLFPHREDGVRHLAARLAERLGPSLLLYASRRGWVAPHQAGLHWADVASANWRASAQWLARGRRDALLVDIGSTTTDVVPVRDGRVVAVGANDGDRLAGSELVYQGVVRTPLCALGQRVPFGGREVQVMNEFFAATADVYRLTRELDVAHDQQPAADNAAKDDAATRQRLARMIGRDARDAGDAAWFALAYVWRERQVQEIAAALGRVIGASGLPANAPLVAAGCGAFLATDLAARLERRCMSFVQAVHTGPPVEAALARWVDVCAPAVAVAMLAARGG